MSSGHPNRHAAAKTHKKKKKKGNKTKKGIGRAPSKSGFSKTSPDARFYTSFSFFLYQNEHPDLFLGIRTWRVLSLHVTLAPPSPRSSLDTGVKRETNAGSGSDPNEKLNAENTAAGESKLRGVPRTGLLYPQVFHSLQTFHSLFTIKI